MSFELFGMGNCFRICNLVSCFYCVSIQISLKCFKSLSFSGFILLPVPWWLNTFHVTSIAIAQSLVDFVKSLAHLHFWKVGLFILLYLFVCFFNFYSGLEVKEGVSVGYVILMLQRLQKPFVYLELIFMYSSSFKEFTRS